jgi:thioredoxin reductase
VFAAGDVTDSPYKQAITASAQGAVAAVQAFTFIKKGGK